MPSRSTRGKRLNELIGEEKDFDGAFWAQEIFKETFSDEEYEGESEKEDKFDDDFFKEESESDGQEVLVKDDKAEFEKGKGLKAGKLKIGKKERDRIREKEREKGIRKGVKKSIKFRRAEGITQKEMLEQAAIIEMYNAFDLTKLIRNEENAKTCLASRKDLGPVTWRYRENLKSGKRKSTIWHTENLQSFLRDKPIKRVCAVTGSFAKYKDPLTGKYYCNKEAFKAIRSQYYAEREAEVQEHIKELEFKLSNYT